MKRVRYTKFTGDLSSSFGLEDLMQALSDFLLDSGFNDPYANFSEFNDQTLENLRNAIRRALESGELLDEEAQEKYETLSEDQVEELIDKIIAKMQEQNFINAELPQQPGEAGNGNAENARSGSRQEEAGRARSEGRSACPSQAGPHPPGAAQSR